MARSNFEGILVFIVIFFEFIKKVYFYNGGVSNVAQAYLVFALFAYIFCGGKFIFRKEFFAFLSILTLSFFIGVFFNNLSFNIDYNRLIYWLLFALLLLCLRDINLRYLLESYIKFFILFVIVSLAFSIYYGLNFIVIDSRLSFFSSEPSHFSYFIFPYLAACHFLGKKGFFFGFALILSVFSLSSVTPFIIIFMLWAFPWRSSGQALVCGFALLFSFLMFLFVDVSYDWTAFDDLIGKLVDSSDIVSLNASKYSVLSNFAVVNAIITDFSFLGVGMAPLDRFYFLILDGGEYSFHRLYGLNSANLSTLYFNLFATFGVLSIAFIIFIFRKLRGLDRAVIIFVVLYLFARIAKLSGPWEGAGLLILLFLYHSHSLKASQAITRFAGKESL